MVLTSLDHFIFTNRVVCVCVKQSRLVGSINGHVTKRKKYNGKRTVNVPLDIANLSKTIVMLKCMIGWQHCQSMICAGAIINLMPVYAGL